ncbi:phospholipid carrier-dependent glycosyltransferase [Microbacterium sp. 18062]|uniref:phospholipid carrier-dependent glycosyltransferase n=1 Tax=Microbacterium sp. 18062 TaxID=2681410 RepID=UPI00135A5FF4|nr:phospholipid carrier-dependent glycosyltransferase [Microbacterium sp. 18062]
MNGAVRSRTGRRWALWLLLAATIGGGAVRFGGILWGLPATLHADEWVIVEYAIDMARRNSFEPAFFARPDHLEIQLSYLAYQLWAHLGHGTTPELLYAVSPAPFYAISRAITAFFGTAMIPLAFLIGRVVSRPTAPIMAVFVALFPPFVEHSRYATPDIPLTFTVMVVILGSLRYLRTSSWGDLLLACTGVALGITVKYPAVVGCVIIAAVVVIAALRERRPMRIVSRGAAAIGAVLGGTFALSPVLFTNGGEVLGQLTAQNSAGHLGASGLGFGGNLLFYVQEVLESGGVLLIIFAIAGVVWLGLRAPWDLVPFGISAVYWVFLSRLELHWERWGLPIYLGIVLLGAIGVSGLSRVALRMSATVPDDAPVERRLAGRAGPWTIGILFSLSAVTLASGSLAQLAYALAPDTRVVAASALTVRGVTAENTAYDGYTPFQTDDPDTIAIWLSVADDALEAEPGIEYILTSSLMANRYLADKERPEHEVYVRVAADLPEIERWTPSGTPPEGMWEIERIVRTLPYLWQTFGGGMSGPELVLYGWPVGA